MSETFRIGVRRFASMRLSYPAIGDAALKGWTTVRGHAGTILRAMPSALLALRSLLWTILLPGVLAGYLPWRYFGLREARIDWSNPASLLGLVIIVLGALLLGACILEFARRGRGTLSPVDPAASSGRQRSLSCSSAIRCT